MPAKKIIIDGVIGWDIYASSIRKELENYNDEIIVDISSPGGSVYDGIEIYNVLRDYSKDKNKVTTRNISLAASMASIILLAGDKIVAEENATFMLHNVWSLAIGDHRELKKTADVIEGLSNLLAKTYAKKTGKELSEIRKLMDDETWLFGDEMVKAGFVDEIIKSEKKSEENQSTLISLAKGRVQSCFSLMEKSERSKNDLKKAAALIIDANQKIDVVIEEKKSDKSEDLINMNELEELKAENRKLKNQLENIQAHLTFAEDAPKEVLAAIKNNEEFSPKVHGAKYSRIQMMAEMRKSRQDDNPENVNVNGDNQPENDQKDTDNYIAKMKARRGIK